MEIVLRALRLFLPCLMPSWAFFKEIGPSPRIEYCTESDAPWQPAYVWPQGMGVQRHLQRLFYNADWNAHLFLTSLAERQLIEPDRDVEALIKHVLAQKAGRHVAAFRILLECREGSELRRDITYQSSS